MCYKSENKWIPNGNFKMASTNEDIWTAEYINLLIDKRIARDAVFKTTNSDKIGWLQILSDLKKAGAPKTLNRVNIRRQWFKICEIYKKLSISNERDNFDKQIANFPYYEKLQNFFTLSRNNIHSKNLTQDNKKKMTIKFLKTAQYADRWPANRTEALIEARILRNAMFQNITRGNASLAWQAVISDMVTMGEPHALTVAQVKKKWENLCTRYKVLKEKNLCNTTWPHFPKLNDFFTKNGKNRKNVRQPVKHISKPVQNDSNEYSQETLPIIASTNQNDNNEHIIPRAMVYADRWPNERTLILIKCRIARDKMFDGRGLSSSGWQAVLSDLKEAGVHDDVTICQVKKKWENLCARYKTIKDNKSCKKTWPFFKILDSFLNKKYHTRRRTVENMDDLKPESYLIVDWKVEEQKTINTKCRLCQCNNSDHPLLEDKDLCQRITDCTSIKILENIDNMPSGICESCKTTIDKFYEFLIKCREVDKDLRTNISVLNIKTERSEEQLNTYECSECPVFFNSPEALCSHLKSHKKSSRFHCEICSASFSRQSALYSHIKQHFESTNVSVSHELNEKEVEYFNETAENDSDAIENDHSAQTEVDCVVKDEKSEGNATKNVFTCELCSKTYTNRSGLRNHLETHSRTIHECPREGCNKTYMTLTSLRNHERKHLGLHSYLCVVCGKGFVTKNALKLHEKIHLDVKEYVCDICSRGFSIMSNLRAHQKKHHEGHRFYCSQCPKEFLTKSSLQRHELVHTGVKEFICDTCSSAFYTSKELLKHKRYHDGVRLFHCNQCFKTFYEKHHLTVHIRSHTDERPYPCKIPGCGKSFRESQKLSRHVKIHHRILP